MDENDVRRALGVSKPTMRGIRESMGEGTHWRREEDGSVVYTPAGVAQLETTTGIRLTRLEEQNQEEKEAVVTPIFRRWGNQRMVSATVEGAAVYVHVRPGDRPMYAPGMRIKVKRIPETTSAHWRAVGRPRARGRM